MVKIIKPKTQKAIDFVAENGDKFIIAEQTGPAAIAIISAKTGNVMQCEMRGKEVYINGERMEWEK